MSNLPPSLPVVPVYKDRSTGLMVFGIILILLGACCLLLSIFIGLMPLLFKAEEQPRGVAVIVLFYLAAGAGFIWAGIGSIRGRRWVRPIMLSFSWPWLICGILTVILMIVAIPNFTPPAASAEKVDTAVVYKVMMVVMTFGLALFFIALPGVLIAFYQSKHVKATCESKDPAPGWTDGVPVPVLALSLWLALTVISLIAAPLSGQAVVPVFGHLLSGITGSAVYLVFAVISGWLAWAVYRRDVKAWWVTLVLSVIFFVSAIVTYSMLDMAAYYQALGYSVEEIKRIESFTILSGGKNYALMTAGWMIPSLGYLIYIKRFFHKA